MRAWLMPLALLVVACTSPTPTPTPTASPEPSLHVDGLARVTSAEIRFRVDPSDAKPASRETYPSPENGSAVLLVEGPVNLDGIDYWQVSPSARDWASPLGWVAATASDGTANLAPFQPSCPPADGVSAAQLGAVDGLELIACFGNQELELQGTVTCNYGIADGYLAGPMMNSNIWCGLDGQLALFGPYITTLHADPSTNPIFTGSYWVSGHFDDPGAQSCYQTPFGTSLGGSRTPGDPGAIQQCRMFFVVSAVARS